jgi:hypothetical protein
MCFFMTVSLFYDEELIIAKEGLNYVTYPIDAK